MQTTSSTRLESIDQFRGFAILLMVLANFSGGAQSVPAWLKHAPDIGLTVIDLIAPFFIFAIGLTYGLSARRRFQRDGAVAAYRHFAVRYLAILGIGALITEPVIRLGYAHSDVNWGVLQAIGVAGLVTLLLIRARTALRLACGLLLLAAYQVLLDTLWLDTVLTSPHGGLPGALSWSAMLLLSTVLADLFFSARGRRAFAWAGLGAALLGVLLALWLPVSKNRVSSSYVLITLGASVLLFFLFHFLVDRRGLRLPVLSIWGRNAMLLYLLHYLGIGLFFMPPVPWLYAQAPLWLVGLEAVILVALLSGVGAWMEKHGIQFSL